ncbi:M23 family metallopeptidase [Campylobacter sp. MG1]|uniref:M23 family metallopeptidase n=1 Tax=Campylobacter sp. MG1 TaxID=2976332 RepID=UPI00226D20C6|nr:M23 family metallopeptidase [Campylobacter sp. MG1]
MRRGRGKITVFLLFIIFVIIFGFIAFSNLFERISPNVNINDTIYWNTRDKIVFEVNDNLNLSNILVEYSKNNEPNKNILLNQNVNTNLVNVTIELPKPKFGENISKYTLYIKAKDSSFWNWFMGNTTEKVVSVVIDNTRPQVSILANSYSITKGGAASVVFYVHDENLSELYIDVNSRVFKAIPFLKDNYYIALIAWDIRDNDFSARIIANDKANNIVKEKIPYYIKNKAYRESTISVNDNFINGKIKDLYEINAEENLNDNALIFDYVNATLRKKNENLIHKATNNLTDEIISDFYLTPFSPLKNGMKVADFGDHRYYKYDGNQISESYHMGLDLASTKMAPIVLSNDGKVVFAQDNGIYGLNLIIDHGLGLYTLYGHCSKKNVELGDELKSNTIIANTGTSGLALGDHLHFGVLVQGVEVRPEEWMDSKWMNDNIFAIINKAKDIINKK